ncbi:MAG: complex I NDUFA9 subunit family protein [Stappiaceae bacterium]
MSNAPRGKLVTVFGGSGFVGRHVVRSLAKRGWRVRAAVRRPDLAEYLQPLGTVGQIQAIQANLRYRWSVDRAVQGADAVVNLVGILSESGAQSFSAVQDFGARAVTEASRNAGVSTFVHMSALGADPDSRAAYSRTKAAGEAAVRETIPEAVITRPSIIFGPEDAFFNKFASMMRFSPVLPLIGGGETKFQPVFVGDVAEAIAQSVEGNVAPGTVLELGGSEIKSFRDCLELMLEITNRNRLLAPIPFGIAKPLGRLMQMVPGAPITADQVELLKSDNVVSAQAQAEGRTLDGIGIVPQTLAAILPTYLWRFREHGQFERNRTA